MFAMNQISYGTLPPMKWSQWAKKSGPASPAPTTPPDSFLGNGKPIENADSWRKIRETAAILYREDVGRLVAHGWGTAECDQVFEPAILCKLICPTG
jgi:hypothetical protein